MGSPFDLPPSHRARFALLAKVRGKDDQARALARSARREAPDDSETHNLSAAILGGDIKRWHWGIVRDTVRNDAYEGALRRAIDAGARTVLDIGSGSGLLALLAARAGAESVVTCEMNPALAEQARDIVTRNGYDLVVTVIAKHSNDLVVGEDLEPVDVLVSEIISNGLLGQGLLPVHRDAVARLLKPGGTVIPAEATLMAALCWYEEPVRADLGSISGFDLSLLDELAPPTRSVKPASDRLTLRSSATPLARYRLAAPASWPTGTMRAPVAANGGPVNAVVTWLRLDMDGSGAPGSVYENRPGEAPASCCWDVLVHPLPQPVDMPAGLSARLAATVFGDSILVWQG